jgi:hypothetical protein
MAYGVLRVPDDIPNKYNTIYPKIKPAFSAQMQIGQSAAFLDTELVSKWSARKFHRPGVLHL